MNINISPKSLDWKQESVVHAKLNNWLLTLEMFRQASGPKDGKMTYWLTVFYDENDVFFCEHELWYKDLEVEDLEKAKRKSEWLMACWLNKQLQDFLE